MILITGSKGLVGQALKARLEQLSIAYVGIDNRYEASHSESGDILHSLVSQIDLKKITGVVHLAAVSRVIFGEKNPRQCWQTNVLGTYQLLNELFKTKHQPWFLYASSREVYGQQINLPVKETATLLPLNNYAYSKMCAENIVNVFKQHGLKTQILRFSSVYGRVDDYPDRVIPAFCRAAVRSEPLRIDGVKNQLDFTFIDDVVDGIIKTIFSMQENRKLPPAMHLTSNIPTTLYDAALIATRAAGNRCEFIEAPSRSYDVSNFYGDPTLAFNTLGWKPKVSLEEGVHLLVKAFFELREVADENT